MAEDRYGPGSEKPGPSNAPEGREGTTWAGGNEPAAPWERNSAAGWGAPGEAGEYPPTPPERDQAPKRRRTGLYVVIALVVLALGAAIALPGLLDGSGNTGSAGTQNGDSSQSSAQFQAQPGPVQQANGTAPDWTATAEAVAPSVVAISVNAYQGEAQGSGVIIDTTGHVITNNHVVAEAVSGRGEITVTLDDKRTYQARVVGADASTDLAVLEMTNAPDDLRAVTFGNSDELKVGVPVMAIGNPLGLSGTVTEGIVSALDRPLLTSGEATLDGTVSEDIVTNAIQTSAAINPGNSGGALVNASGQLIGINSSIAQTQQGGGNIGIGFAIPVNAARNIADQLMTNGTVEHSFLGVSAGTGNVPEGDAQRAAAVVAEVAPGSPAAEAGVRRGDAVVALNGDPVDSSQALVAQVRDHRVGDSVSLTLVRNGQRSDVQVTLSARPQENQTRSTTPGR